MNERDIQIRFSFREFDLDGPWTIHKVGTSHAARLLKRLRALEEMTSNQMITKKIMSELDMSKCPNKGATTRLAQQYNGLDVLHEIRVAQSESLRLHGRLAGRFFHIIWWDPNHEVWPEGKWRR